MSLRSTTDPPRRSSGLRGWAGTARARLLTAGATVAVLALLGGTTPAAAADDPAGGTTPAATAADPTVTDPTAADPTAADPTAAPVAPTWLAADPSVFGMGDSLFMQCGDSLGVGTRSMGMVGWPSATSDDLRARMSSGLTDWPWMTEPSHAAELTDFHTAATWVIGLGTNDVKRLTRDRYAANVEWFMQQAAGRPVLWFNLHDPHYPATVATFNQVLADAGQRWPNLRILDWNGLVSAAPEALAADGVHVASYQACRRSRNALIQAAVPPVAGQPDSPDWTDPAPQAPPNPDPVTAEYQRTGGAGGPLGDAVSALDCTHRNDGCVQFFSHGALAWSPASGVHALPAAAAAAWHEHAETGGPGYPTGDAVCTLPNSGCRQQFQTGPMYWSRTTAAFEVNGPILGRYLALGGPAGSLGYPVNGSPCGLAGVGCMQDFQHGSIYWSATTGAQAVTGAVRARWLVLGAQDGALGYPTISTTCIASGCGQHFQGGSIYASPTTGARVLTGAVRARWIAAGGTRSGLGYPTIDTACISSGCGQHFQGGSIYWAPSSGAHLVLGPVRALWLAAGGPKSDVGYPRAEQVRIRGGLAQRFQHGDIRYLSGRRPNRTPRNA